MDCMFTSDSCILKNSFYYNLHKTRPVLDNYLQKLCIFTTTKSLLCSPFLEHCVIAYNRILPQSNAVQYYIFLYSSNIK